MTVRNNKSNRPAGLHIARKATKHGVIALASLLSTTSLTFAVDPGALPQGGTVASGDASFDYSATQPRLDVNQTSLRAVIDWHSFDIGTQAHTNFNQTQGGSSIAVNRVHDANPSQILGSLTANGNVVVLNQNGVFFGQNAHVDVGGLIVSTGELDISAFEDNGAVKLSNINANPNAGITNKGSISVKQGGLAAFVAPNVVNDGVIMANLGKVALAAGADKATVDLYGDGLVELALDDKATKALIENNGTIKADGGTVAITAAAAKEIADSVINMGGVVEANTVGVKNGKIILGATNADIHVNGKINAKGGKGEVKITSDKNIGVWENAEINADAGEVGDGGKVEMIAQKSLVFLGNVSARGGSISGDGGFVDTSGLGNIYIDGNVNASAENGVAGLWYIDPTNLLITNSGLVSTNVGGDGSQFNQYIPDGDTISILKSSKLNDSLNGGTNVYVTTIGSPNKSLQDGTITIDADIQKSAGGNTGTLYMTAAGSITLNSGKKIYASGDGNTLGVSLIANKDVNINGTIDTKGGAVVLEALGITPTVILGVSLPTGDVNIGSSGKINTSGGAFTATAAKNAIINGDIATGAGNVKVVAEGNAEYSGNITVGADGSILTTSGDIELDARGASVDISGIDVAFGNNVINGTLTTGSGDITLKNLGILKSAGNKIYSASGNVNLEQNSAVAVLPSSIPTLIADLLSGNLDLNSIIDVGSIQNAIDSIADGGTGTNTITVGAGIYLESVNADHDNLVLNGKQVGHAGTSRDILDALQNDPLSILETESVVGLGTTGFNVTGNNVTIDGFTIAGTGTGVAVSGDNAKVQNNIIGLTTGAGISADGVTGLDVNNNLLAVTGGNSIDLYDVDGANVDDNTIVGSLAHGVSVVESSNVFINSNDITGTVGNGIFVDPSFNIWLTGNNITGTVSDGIYAMDTIGLFILGNNVSLTGGDGIEVYNSAGVVIADNTVLGALGGDGIKVDRTIGDLIAGNTVLGTLGNGITLTNSAFGGVFGNIVGLTAGDGIHLDTVGGVLVAGNVIGLTGDDGIDIDDSNLVGVVGNVVALTGDNGIEISDTDNVAVALNAIALTGGDGINVRGSDNLLIALNAIVGTQDDGIDAGFIDDAYIGSNLIVGTGDDGINVFAADDTTIRDNIIAFNGDDGISVHFANDTLIDNNTIAYTGDDGIDVGFAYDTTISDNDISNVADDGIYLHNASLIDIHGNDVAFAGNDGIEIHNSGNFGAITLDDNRVNDSAENGLYVSGGNNGDIILTRNVFTDNKVGARFESGNIDLTAAGAQRNIINGGTVGLLFDPNGYDPLNLTLVDDDGVGGFGGTIGGTEFNGQSQYYVELRNGAFFEPGTPTLLNGYNAIFDGKQVASMTNAEYGDLLNKIWDYNDDNTVGLFFPSSADINDILPEQALLAYNAFRSPLVTIIGLPYAPGSIPVNASVNSLFGAAALNNIATAAGGDNPNPEAAALAKLLNNVESGSGENTVGCWGQVYSSLNTQVTTPVTYNFNVNPFVQLADQSNCGTTAGL